MTQEQRIIWKEEPLKSGVSAYNKKGEELGWLEYRRVGAFMHWCWFQEQDIQMSPGCLQEVRDKQKELLRQNHQKSNRK